MLAFGMIAAGAGFWSCKRIFFPPIQSRESFWAAFGRKPKSFLLVIISLTNLTLLLIGCFAGQFVFQGNIGITDDGTLHKSGFYLAPPRDMASFPLHGSVSVQTDVPTKNTKPINPYQNILKVSIDLRLKDRSKLINAYDRVLASGSLQEEVRFQLLPAIEDPSNIEELQTRIKKVGQFLQDAGYEAHIRYYHTLVDRQEYRTNNPGEFTPLEDDTEE